MYLAGDSVTEIALALGAARQTVSKRCSSEGWRRQRDTVATETANQTISSLVISNREVLARHDGLAAKLLLLAERQLDRLMARPPQLAEPGKLRAIAAVLFRGMSLQRAARGMPPSAGLTPERDDTLRVEIRTLPPTREEFELLKAFRARKAGDVGEGPDGP